MTFHLITLFPSSSLHSFSIHLQEDRLVLDLVMRHGAKKWSFIASHLTGRIGKQCRERWANHLNPNIKKGPWTEDEDKKIIEVFMRRYI